MSSVRTDLGANEKLRPLDNKEFAVLESVHHDRMTIQTNADILGLKFSKVTLGRVD